MFEKITQLSHPLPLCLRMHGQLFVLMCKLQYRHFDVYLYMCVYVRGWHFLEVAVSCTQCTFRSSYVQEVSAQHRVLSKLTWPNISIVSAHLFRCEISKIGKKVYKLGFKVLLPAWSAVLGSHSNAWYPMCPDLSSHFIAPSSFTFDYRDEGACGANQLTNQPFTKMDFSCSLQTPK